MIYAVISLGNHRPSYPNRDRRSHIRLISRNGRDLIYHFPLISAAISALAVNSCVIDGEAIVCDGSGYATELFRKACQARL